MATILSLHGKGLKLDTREDIEPYLRDVDPTKLEEICFGGNTIGVEASQALAEFLQKATSLKVADFADIFTGRLITEIPQALSAICDALIDKMSLVEIDLSDNAFGGRSVDPMVPFLTKNRSFQVLKLNNNGLGPAGGSIIADALRRSAELSKEEGKQSNLRTVICGRNRLENGSAPTWAAAFAAHGNLVEVRMPQNGIRMEGITALARGLAKNANVEYIDLQDNAFAQAGAKAFADALPSWPKLHTLNLSDCFLSEGGEVPSTLKVLATGSNPLLRTLQLQNNNLEGNTAALLADVIGTHLKAVELLEFQWNEADEDDEGIQTVADSLKARGGQFILMDEEEEEVKEEGEIVEEAKAEEAAEPTEEPCEVDQATNALADLLGKVTID
ncbi:hypothetical protein EWM64_g131 [Hericium alpestre]|uniref:Ran-GTPase activating protein 1 C-terminal domain-containing protein n=1 Tax=Hericium alpestre TaxID=135208 RepID=A0A4Z0A9U5_9AGAM|nr:hypothetical protein EWM64_g131 [Hericium alpestre]